MFLRLIKSPYKPLDSCNENLPEKSIHRNYASRPGEDRTGLFAARTQAAAGVFSCEIRKG
jgi:hypothetical protein